MANFIDTVAKVFPIEGGFQNYESDSANYCGGQLIGTNRGISAIAYKEYYGVCPSVEAIKSVTKEQATEIYKKNYWSLINGDKIKNQSVAELMFQYVIGSGQSQISNLKLLANDTGGGRLTLNDRPITDAEAAYINSLDQKKYFDGLWNFRKEFFYKVVKADPADEKFLNGWLTRLNSHVYKPEIDKKKILIVSLLTILLSVVIVKKTRINTVAKILLIALFATLAWFTYDKANNLKNNI